MTKTGVGRFVKRGDRVGLEVDAAILGDEAFPFKDGESIRFRIEGGSLVIERARRAKSGGRGTLGKVRHVDDGENP